MKKIADSIKAYFKSVKLTQTEVADRLGCSQVYVSAICNDRQEFKTRTATSKWAEVFGFNEVFLLTGVGSLFPDDDQSIMSRVNEEMQSDDSIPADVRLIKEQAKVEELRKQVDSLQEELREAYKTIARLEIRLEEQELKKDQAIS